MAGIRRISDLGTRGAVNIVDGSIQTADIANNAITQAKLDTAIPLSGMRNALINGDFKIWQRGAGPYDGTAYRYTSDRWQAVRGGYTSGQSLTRQNASLDGFQYCARVARDSGNTSTAILYLAQTLETINSIQFQNKQVTLSFYARSGANYSASGSSLNARLATGTGTDQNHFNGGFTNETNIINSNVTLTTSWQRFILSGTAASNITQVGLTFLFTPSGTAGANDYFEITGVQLEQGSQPTQFEQRSYATELQLCQRYFEKSSNMSDTVGNSMGINGYMVGCWYNDGWPGRLSIPFKVTKRSNPGVTLYGPSGQNSGWWVYGLNAVQYAARGTSVVGANETYVQISVSTWNGTSGTLQFSAGASYLAEGAWTASSEL